MWIVSDFVKGGIKLLNLEKRRLRRVMTEIYKYMKVFDEGDIHKVLLVGEVDRTRSNV